jgi:hypothetical protein
MTLFRRSAAYANNLVKIANLKAGLANQVRVDMYVVGIEITRKKDLEIVFQYIEGSANQGAVRIQNWSWSTPEPIRKLLFEDEEIQNYMIRNGFRYSTDTIEWYHAEKELK